MWKKLFQSHFEISSFQWFFWRTFGMHPTGWHIFHILSNWYVKNNNILSKKWHGYCTFLKICKKCLLFIIFKAHKLHLTKFLFKCVVWRKLGIYSCHFYALFHYIFVITAAQTIKIFLVNKHVPSVLRYAENLWP